MLRSNNITLKGRLVVDKFDDNMNLIEKKEIPNLVVTAGKEWLAARLGSAGGQTTAQLKRSGQLAVGYRYRVCSIGTTDWNTVGGTVAATGTGGTPTLSTVVITGTGGTFSCASTTLKVGMSVKITGTAGGTGSISGYATGTTYYIIATNGTTTFTLSTSAGGSAITTTSGTPTGLTYTLSNTLSVSGSTTGSWAVGQVVYGTNVVIGTKIAQLGSGTGGTGTYVLDTPASGSISGGVTGGEVYEIGRIFTAATAGLKVDASSTTSSGSAGSTSLTVGGTISGTFTVGQTVFGTGVADNSVIVSQSSGTTGGAGVYVLSLPLTGAASGGVTTQYDPGIGILSASMGFMAIGDGTDATAVGQTSLQKETARVSVSTATSSGLDGYFTAIFPAGTPSAASNNIYEAGMFNQPDSKVKTFDASSDVNGTTHTINITAHGFSNGDKVTYQTGGGTALSTGTGNLTNGGTYYVIYVDADNIKLALTAADAAAATAINIGTGTGSNQKIIYGTMLCRTTFPVITKSSSETVAITWIITVG